MDYLKTGDISLDLIKSWKRCKDRGLKSSLKKPSITLQKDFVNKNQLLNRSFLCSLKKIEGLFKEYRATLILTDCSGYVINYLKGFPQKESWLFTGASLAEESTGTSAFSLAINLQKPVFLEAGYSYCDFLKKWHGFVIPLRGINEIGGFLGLLMLPSRLKDFLIGINQLLSYQISAELRERENYQNLKNINITRRQKEVLFLLSRGFTEQAVAVEMGISINTVKYHKREIFERLEARCVSEAVFKAYKSGLIN